MKWLLVAIIVAATTIGELLQAVAMKRHGEIHDFRPGAIGRLLAILAKYLLKENVGVGRWAGASLVACGVALLAL